jgi:Uma2 family endonuclease
MAVPQLVRPTPRRFTRAEYDRLIELGFFRNERLELIHGTLLDMPPSGPPHATVVSRLNRLLVPPLLDRAEVRIQQPIYAHDESEPEPDVAVVPLGDYSKRHPEGAILLIEVAESSLEYDRDSKAPLYAASKVREYWIVDIPGRIIEVYTGPSDAGYERSRRAVAGERLSPEAFPDLVIDVASVFPPAQS